MAGQVVIDDNPVTKWMFGNTIVKEIGDNIRLDKLKKAEKIDGVMSVIMCFGGYLNQPHHTFNVW